jgi:hypothetical protein
MTLRRLVIADGGREAAGFRDEPHGGCVARAICLATQLPYGKVHGDLRALCMIFAQDTWYMRRRRKAPDPDRGLPETIWKIYLNQLGWAWVPVGQKLHFTELPNGRLVVIVLGHAVAVIDRGVFDTYDSWKGRRFVQGYWHK